MAKVKQSESANQEPVPPTGLAEPAEFANQTGADADGADQSDGAADHDADQPRDSRDAAINALRIAIIVVGAVAVCLAAALIILLVRFSTPTQPATTPAPTGTATPLYLQNYVAANPGQVKAGAVIVEIHDDYQCPWCARAEEIYGDALGELSRSGDIDLRIHIRTLVGDQIIHNDSSERSARAAVCADQVGAFWAYHSAIFANQPEEGVGYTDDQLRTVFAGQAGITGRNLTTFQTCYDTKATAQQVAAMEQEGTAAGINGTPTFYVNGRQVNFDLQANSATVQKIPAADLLDALKNL